MSEKGNFFAVDRRCVEAACSQPDGLNLGVGYLVMARFASGKNHSSTQAGMTALHTRLGLSRGRADATLMGLENAGFATTPSKAGTRKLIPWAERQAEAAGMSDKQREVLARIKGKRAPILSSADPDYQAAYTLCRKGGLAMTEAPAGKPKFEIPKPDFLYLPNTLVDGFRQGDVPLARLRQIADARALRTLINLYQFTDLPEQGGVPRSMIREEFEQFETARWGGFTIWGFASKGERANWSTLLDAFGTNAGTEDDRSRRAQEFWSVWGALKRAGLVEMVSYLFESEAPTAQPIHALAAFGGTEEERTVTQEAEKAAYRMMSEAQITRAFDNIEGARPLFCPVPSHVINVRLIGIARPVHRANTSRTRAWAKMYLHSGAEHAELF